ncbi:MAG: GDSL-type esterase/lipase family protein [Verrucomicrobiota bacterium]
MRIKFIHRWLTWLCLTFATPLLADNPYRILVTGDSISVGYTDNPNWTVPYEFGFRSGLYTRLTNSGMAVQFVGNSPEPWNGKFGTPTNTPTLDLRPLGQDRCEGYGGQKTSYILSNISYWLTLHSPDIVLLMIGINDIPSGSTAEPAAAEQNLSNIVYTVTANAPNTRLIVAQITPYANTTLAIVTYNNYIRNTLVPYFAGQGKYVTTVDQYTNLCIPGTLITDTSLYANGINHPNATAYDRMAQTWFEGIQSLTLPTPQAPAAPSTNGGFETPVFGANTHTVNPGETGWMFTIGSVGAGSGIERGNPYNASSGSVAYEGAQQAFLQGSGNTTTTRIWRAFTDFTVGQYYQVSFYSKSINGYGGVNPFKVRMIDGNAVTSLFGGTNLVPATNHYTAYVSEPFLATSTNMTLDFSDLGGVSSTKVSWIDAVTISPMPTINPNGFVNGNQFKLQFNGFTNVSYSVLGTTNLSLPLASWPALGPAQWLSNNVFQFIDVQATNQGQRFYRIRLN